MWKYYWTRVRLSPPPPKRVFVELFKSIEIAIFQTFKNFYEHKTLNRFKMKRRFFRQKY